MRILVWHGWLLEGSGSNVYTARIVEAWRAEGHDVLLLCQEPHPERHRFLDAYGQVGRAPRPLPAEPARGRAVLLRPDIGDLLPVFVWDAYEGFRVKTFVDLTDAELATYLQANVAALRRAAADHGSELVVAGHALPGPVVARRAVPEIPQVAKIHGSDIEYAMRAQPRYVDLAREGLEGARTVAGASHDVLERLVELVPTVADRVRVVAPGVEVERFRPLPRRRALLEAADPLGDDPSLRLGRSEAIQAEMLGALAARDALTLDALATRYEQTAPDPGAPDRLRGLADSDRPLIGYLGKLIPQKGVHHLLAAAALLDPAPEVLVIGFGTLRDWLEALLAALDAGDPEAVGFVAEQAGLDVPLTPGEIAAAAGLARRVRFTGRLVHRYAAPAVAALDVLVVPSVMEEAFGMVALEGAVAGALPLVARHSGLAEVAGELEAEIARPGLLSFEPGSNPPRELARGLRALLDLPGGERKELAGRLSAHVRERRTWARTAEALLAPARN